MEVYKGRATFAGIAIGKIRYYQKGEYHISQYLTTNVKREISLFHNARNKLLQELIHQEHTEEVAKQIQILQSDSYRRAVEGMITAESVNTAYAVMTTRDELVRSFSMLDNAEIQARIQGIKTISGRLIKILGGVAPRIDLGSEPVILVADSLSPSEIMEMDKNRLLAVVTYKGSEISHAAILAKTMAIPSMFGIKPEDDWEDAMAIVDGYTGTLYLYPDEEVIREYEIRRQADLQEKEGLLEYRDKDDRTIDGKEIGIYANIGNLDDLNNVSYYHAAGIGLMRSEFQYLGRENYPREEELFQAYKQVAEAMGEKEVVIRTVDLGADKQAPYLEIPEETNPIMGNRGIRLCIDRDRMFRAQLRAIYRASVYGNLALMYPMICSEKEMDEVERLVEQAKEELRKKGQPYRDIRTGIMIETPAAVMISEELAERVDFLGLGTNDLTQYTLAMDRQNPLLRNKYEDHHPAILRMIKMVIDAGHSKGKNVYICGELAADTNLTEMFLRMGVDALSVVPACILPVRKALREVNLSEAAGQSKNQK